MRTEHQLTCRYAGKIVVVGAAARESAHGEGSQMIVSDDAFDAVGLSVAGRVEQICKRLAPTQESVVNRVLPAQRGVRWQRSVRCERIFDAYGTGPVPIAIRRRVSLRHLGSLRGDLPMQGAQLADRMRVGQGDRLPVEGSQWHAAEIHRHRRHIRLLRHATLVPGHIHGRHSEEQRSEYRKDAKAPEAGHVEYFRGLAQQHGDDHETDHCADNGPEQEQRTRRPGRLRITIADGDEDEPQYAHTQKNHQNRDSDLEAAERHRIAGPLRTESTVEQPCADEGSNACSNENQQGGHIAHMRAVGHKVADWVQPIRTAQARGWEAVEKSASHSIDNGVGRGDDAVEQRRHNECDARVARRHARQH